MLRPSAGSTELLPRRTALTVATRLGGWIEVALAALLLAPPVVRLLAGRRSRRRAVIG